MLRCWHLLWILVRTDHPCLGVGCHTYVFRINLFITLDSRLRKKITGVDPHYLDIRQPAQQDDAGVAKKLVSNNFRCYA
jgi:hypothetical protein